jgi:hypothetical protein
MLFSAPLRENSLLGNIWGLRSGSASSLRLKVDQANGRSHVYAYNPDSVFGADGRRSAKNVNFLLDKQGGISSIISEDFRQPGDKRLPFVGGSRPSLGVTENSHEGIVSFTRPTIIDSYDGYETYQFGNRNAHISYAGGEPTRITLIPEEKT